MPKIMIVDDDVTIQMELEEYLTHMGHIVVGIADTGTGAVEMARAMKPDLILMDINLPGEMDGISAAEKIKEDADAAVVFITGFGNPEYIERAKRVEPYGYVMKPFDENEINGNIEIALHKRKLELELVKVYKKLKESENRYRDLVEQQTELICRYTPDFRLTFVNSAYCRYFGRQYSDLIGTSFMPLLPEEDREKVAREHYALLESEVQEAMHEHQVVNSKGEISWMQWNNRPLYDSEGRFREYQSVGRDISGKKLAEKKLFASEEKFRLMAETIAEDIWQLDLKGDVTYASPGVQDIFGYFPEEAMGLKFGAFFLETETVSAGKAFSEAVLGHPHQLLEFQGKRKDGSLVPIEVSLTPIIQNDTVVGVQGITRDITDRKRMAEEREQTLSQLEATLDAAVDGIIVVSLDLRIRVCSKRFKKIWGMPDSILESKDMNQTLEYVLGQLNDPEVFSKRVRTVFTGLNLNTFDTLHLKDGRIFEVYSRPQKLDDKIIGRVWAFRDVTEPKRAEQALRESEERFRLTFDTSPDAISINQVETGRYVDINKAFTRLTGFTRENVIGRTPMEINVWYDLSDQKKLNNDLQSKGFCENLEAKFRRKDGSLTIALMSARIISMKGIPHIISITRDISDIREAEETRQKLQSQIQQALKMEAMGTLAGGIAHDFNNLLMAIQGRASLMLMKKDPFDSDFEHLRGIESHVESAADLTKQLLGFSRGGKYEVRPTDLNDLIKRQNHMFGRTKKEITIHEKYGVSLWFVEVDRGQIEQILLNLYVNAWQAMPGGGDLYLETENVTLDENYVKPFSIEPGRYVKISVTDTGIGMDKATREKIFDPFFTTKEMGRSTGLGLASVYGIIKNHGGFINAYSEKGHGATFNLYLPASEKEIIGEKKLAGDLLRGTETVLFVDDENMIIDVAKEVLEHLGYKVLIAGSGKEAIEIYNKSQTQIDIVLLDMVMPDMNGSNTYDRMKDMNPNVKVLLSSGYSINSQATEILDRGCNGFIQKPFKMKELSQKLREILDKK